MQHIASVTAGQQHVMAKCFIKRFGGPLHIAAGLKERRGIIGFMVSVGLGSCRLSGNETGKKKPDPLHNDSSLMLMSPQKNKAAVTGSRSAIHISCDRVLAETRGESLECVNGVQR